MRAITIPFYILWFWVLLSSLNSHAQELSSLISLTWEQHPAMRAQLAGTRAAQSDIAVARSAFAPTASLSWEKVQQKALSDAYYSGDPQVTQWRLNQPVWTGGRLSANLEKSLVQHRISQLQADETRLQLALKVVQNWADWYSGSLKQAALTQSLHIHQQLKDQIARRVTQGLSASGEIILSASRLEQAQSEVLSARMQTQMALMRLQELTGQAVQPLPSDRRDALKPTDPEPMWQQAQAQSATLQRLQAQQMVIQHEQTITRASALPEVFVRAERQMGNHATLNTPAYNRIFVGLSASTGAGLSVLMHLAN